ncbi:MAG: hypothetical protein NVSMB2_19290 [Chloroflexota bacterium]
MSDAASDLTSSDTVDIGWATDVGRVREANEDALLTLQPEGGREGQTLVAVADGMGGHKAGEVASALAIESLGRALARADAAESPDALLREAVELANQTIWTAAAEDAAREGMGTTLVCALVEADGTVLVGNVGDSRAYLVHDGGAHLVTSDHTWVNQQVRCGLMTERDAQTSPFRNLLTRSLGNAPEVDVDLYPLTLSSGDVLVLVSDGVTGYLDTSDVASVVRHTTTAQEAAERLVTEAVNRGGADNATAVVVRRR